MHLFITGCVDYYKTHSILTITGSKVQTLCNTSDGNTWTTVQNAFTLEGQSRLLHGEGP